MEIDYVNCPRCGKSFHCDANLVGIDLPLHCPHCDLYFDQRPEPGKRPPRGTAFSGLSRVGREVIYLPGKSEDSTK